jgi:predicted enzyme related to lactoylglutathione lyase
MILSFSEVNRDFFGGHALKRVTMARMAENSSEPGRVIGIGGVFFKSPDHARSREWYAQQLGIEHGNDGAMFKWRSVPDSGPATDYLTIWSIFPSASKYFDPSPAPFMMNYIVDDLDAILAKLAKNGVRIDPKRDDFDYGRFAWIYDPDGNKIELWEPKTG